MPETTPLIKAALNLRGGAGFDVYVFGLWHKANSAHFSGSYEKICSQIKKLTCNCSFSELTSHTTKAIRKSFVSPVFCRMYPSP